MIGTLVVVWRAVIPFPAYKSTGASISSERRREIEILEIRKYLFCCLTCGNHIRIRQLTFGSQAASAYARQVGRLLITQNPLGLFEALQ